MPNKTKTLSSNKVPVEFGNFAAKRIKPMIQVWARRGEFNLLELAASCYLQGVNDGWQTVESVAPEAAEAFYKVIEVIQKQDAKELEK